MVEDEHRNDEPESRPAAVLHPIGDALRSTYDAENHDSLGSDLTGLMLQLARVDDAPPAAAATPAPMPPVGSTSWLRRLFGRLAA